jgi:hypothetical protein
MPILVVDQISALISFDAPPPNHDLTHEGEEITFEF